MQLTGAGIAGLVGGLWPGTAMAAEGQDADLVLLNGKVYTVDSRVPRVEAAMVRPVRLSGARHGGAQRLKRRFA